MNNLIDTMREALEAESERQSESYGQVDWAAYAEVALEAIGAAGYVLVDATLKKNYPPEAVHEVS